MRPTDKLRPRDNLLIAFNLLNGTIQNAAMCIMCKFIIVKIFQPEKVVTVGPVNVSDLA